MGWNYLAELLVEINSEIGPSLLPPSGVSYGGVFNILPFYYLHLSRIIPECMNPHPYCPSKIKLLQTEGEEVSGFFSISSFALRKEEEYVCPFASS